MEQSCHPTVPYQSSNLYIWSYDSCLCSPRITSSFEPLRLRSAALLTRRLVVSPLAMTKRKLEEVPLSSVEAHLVKCSPFEAQYEPQVTWMGDCWCWGAEGCHWSCELLVILVACLTKKTDYLCLYFFWVT